MVTNLALTDDANRTRDGPVVTDLVTRPRNGDAQAWDALVEQDAPLIWSICRSHQLADAAADSVGQTVWAKLADQTDRIRDPTAFPADWPPAPVGNSADWQKMLAAAARFHNYSWRNVLLILRQRPDATRVAGYRTWQSMGRQVHRSERRIAIFAPVSYRVADDELEEGSDRHAGEPPVRPERSAPGPETFLLRPTRPRCWRSGAASSERIERSAARRHAPGPS
jgi:hypothetical protein